jgi:hypothetical protein
MVRLRGYHLIEISNHHSRTEEDVRRWTAVLRHRGRHASVGAAAGDDLHRESDFDTGWVMVKTPSLAPGAFLGALRGLALYASTGPAAEFTVRDGAVTCATDAARIRFIDASGVPRREVSGPEAAYAPAGDEGYVRVECAGRARAAAWSQPFWLVPV